MSKLKTALTALIVLLLALSLTACIPSSYTGKQVKKLGEEHYKEAEDWFVQNYPDAEIGKKCEGFTDGVDLYEAVQGSYKHLGGTHKFIYCYEDDKMYVDEFFEETEDLLLSEVIRKLGFSEERTDVNLYGVRIIAKSVNDNEYENIKAGEVISSPEVMYLPFGKPEKLAESIMDGSCENRFSVYYCCEDIPEDIEFMPFKYPNLMFLTSIRTIEPEFEGIYYSTQFSSFKEQLYLRTEELKEGLYGGYSCEVQEDGSFENDPVIFKETDDGFTLEIPEDTKLVLFSGKKLKPVQIFSNIKLETFEEELKPYTKSTFRDMKECALYGAQYLFKGDYYVYECRTNGINGGFYTFKLK